MRQFLIVSGLILLIAGLGWPWLSRIPIGRLPGDIVIDRPGFRFYFPVTTMIIISAFLSFIMWLIKK
jgi:hypothetical protein